MRSINQAIALLFILAVGMCFPLLEARYTNASLVECLVPGIECRTADVAQNPIVSKNQPKPPTVVFFGSSTTVGIGASRGDRRWTTLLSRYLGWQEINEGISGSTVTTEQQSNKSGKPPSGVQRWREAVVSHHPDRVVIMYGVNDAYQRLPLGSSKGSEAGTFNGDWTRLLAGLRTALQSEQLIVSTPQPNLATQERRTPYDLALQQGARQVGARFIDAGHEAFSSSDLRNYSADGLHLNNLGHAALASFMAGKMVDLNLVPPPPAAQGGNEFAEKPVPLPGGFLRIDLDSPLKFGEIREIEAQWVAPGQAILAVMRPDGRDGYEVLYRTARFPVSPGKTRITVPRWWVLDGDRLAVWTEGDCLGARELPVGNAHHVSFFYGVDADIRDLAPNAGKPEFTRLAIRSVATPQRLR